MERRGQGVVQIFLMGLCKAVIYKQTKSPGNTKGFCFVEEPDNVLTIF
jgi:hypothetical protein